MAPRPDPSTLWLAVPAALVALIAVVAVVVGGTGRGVDDATDGAPAVVVGDYLAALDERDAEAALHALAPDLRRGCTADEVRRNTRDRRHGDRRVSLVATEDLDDGVEVEVRRTERRGEPPFGDATYETTEVFALERHDGRWVITEAPWTFDVCGRWAR